MAISAVGSITGVEATNQLTFTISTTTIGNAVLVGCRANTPSQSIDSLSGGGCTWTNIGAYFSVARGRRYEIWLGVVSTVVTNATVTVSWSGDMSTKTMAYNPQEFTNGSNSTWAVDGTASGVETSSTSTTFSWPSLTGAGSGELYFGQGSTSTGTPTGSGTPAGFVFKNTAAFWMYGVTTAASVSPTETNSATANYGGLGALVKATAATPAVSATLTIVPTFTTSSTTTGLIPPDSYFDLSLWKITLPTDSSGALSGSANEITQPALASYKDPYFYLDANNRMVMTAPVVGATTGGSGGVRSELREMESGGSQSAWSMSTASRRLVVSGYYDPTSITGGTAPRHEMIIGQIHATGGTPPIYITADTDASPSRMRVFKDGPGVGNLATGFVPGVDRLTFCIEIIGGNVNIYGCIGDETQLPSLPQLSYPASSFAESTNCYLKAGSYNKTDISSGSSGAAIAKIAYINLNQAYVPVAAGSVSLTATPTLTVQPTARYESSILLTATPTLTANGISVAKPGFTLTATPTLSVAITYVFVLATETMTIQPTLTINLTLRANLFTGIITPTATFGGKISALAITLRLIIQPSIVLISGVIRPPKIFTRYPYPPPQYPFRLIAQEVLSRKIVDWDLPIQSDFSYTTQLSGPSIMQGSFRPEIISVQELGLDGYAYFFHAEIDGEIRATGLFLPPKYGEASLEFTCEGFAALPHYITWESTLSQIGIDPLTVVRNVWNHVQSNPLSNLGVVVSNATSTQKLGTAARTETITNPDGTTTTNDIKEEPYELQWWDAVNCGDEIDNLSGQTPFDYRERVGWNSTKTDVTLLFDMGYPRLGVPRSNLLFNDENILEIVPIQEKADSFASEIIVIGAGEGSASIRGYAAQAFGKRIRKVHVVTDKTISTTARANTRATSELGLRKGNLFSIDEIVIRAKHPNASLGEYDIGDDILVNVNVPWLMGYYSSWYRINSINYTPAQEIVRLKIQRSDTYRYPTG